MSEPSGTHLVLLPSYNSGSMLARVAEAVAARWLPVWIVIDASTDGSAATLDPLLAANPHIRRIVLAENSGKGGAVLAGMREALAAGFTHMLVMDADGQHSVDAVAPFSSARRASPTRCSSASRSLGPTRRPSA